ncbi:MAG: sugar nucleotide-binding protein [Myxococcales bacterium FL481]|nr:MAG: sugar nucleotide-binding protein [Myxococcales bacterium FL481]
MTAQRRVLITGAHGNLGPQLVKTYADWDVIAGTRDRLDITDRDAVFRFVETRKPDLIINAAAYNLVDRAEDPQWFAMAQATNGDGPGYLALAAAGRGIPFLHYSSDYVFRGDAREGYVEEDTPDPISRYGATKLAGERAVQAAGGQTYICRLSKIFGPPGESTRTKESFVGLMLRLAASKPSLDIVDEEIGSPSYTVDIAAATRRLLDGDYGPGVYHLVNAGPDVTWYGFAEEFFTLLGVTTPRRPVTADHFPPRPAKRPKYAALRSTKFPLLRERSEALRAFLCR